MPDIEALGRFPGYKAEELSHEQKEVLESISEGRGHIPTPYRFLIVNPSVARALGAFSTSLRKASLLTEREREIVILVTARHFNCPFIMAGHHRMGMEAGLPKAAADSMIEGEVPDLSDPREAAVHELAFALHHDATLSKEKAERAQKVLGFEAVAEIIAFMGNYAANAYALKFVDMKPKQA